MGDKSRNNIFKHRESQQFYSIQLITNYNQKLIMRSKTVDKRNVSMIKSLNPEKSAPLRFYVGSGNNSNLIRKVISTRKNWEEISDSKFLFLNFKWQQSTKGYNYDNCVDTKVFKHCLNHFQFHQQLSNKQLLLKNLTQYCEANRLNVFDFVPVTYVLNVSDSNFDQNQNQFLKFFQFNLPDKLKNKDRKQWLILPKRRMSTGMDKKTTYYYSKPQIRNTFISQDTQYLWLLKPSFRNCGKGIHVFNKIQNLQDLMKHYLNQTPTNIHSTSQYSFIIQKYLQRPLLIEGRKFDIRVWILFTHQLKVFFFKQGYVRTSSSTYSMSEDTFQNANIHLTNNAIQKYGSQYGKFQQGNQLSFKFLSNYISRKGGNFTQILSQMKKIVKLTALSVRKKLNKLQRQFCFQIFGYDFMIDEQMKPWLIEANTNPCLQESSLILQNLLPRMLDDAFKLTIDEVFSASSEGNKSTYILQNYENSENMWQPIVDLKKYS